MNQRHSRSKFNNNLGFTLVELIVVLVILGILASAAVYGISGYIDMTRFRNNEQNALSVFQSAQAAVNHMEQAGTAEKWSQDLISFGTPDEYNYLNPGVNDNIYNQSFFNAFPTDPGNQTGQSVHMRYAVTLTPGSDDAQSKCIKDLIGDDYKSSDVLDALITIEFDIEKTLDNAGKVRYSANVYSVFYDSKRTVWDSRSKNNISSIVPYRGYDYRSSTSLTGYSNPLGASSAVDTVFIPAEAEIKNTIVSLRNGETLDLSWSATSDTQPVTGKPAQIHYTFSLYDDDSGKKFCDIVFNEDNILGGTPVSTLIGEEESFYNKLQFTADDFKNNHYENKTVNKIIDHTNYTVVYTSEDVSDERGVPVTIYRATLHTFAKGYVKRYSGTQNRNFDYNTVGDSITHIENYFTFPLAVSYEIHEGDGVSDRITYTVSLDAMMARNISNANEVNDSSTNALRARTMNFSFNRLFNGSYLTKNTVPKNFFAVMVVDANRFAGGNNIYNDSTGFATSDAFYAERALDDPLYLTDSGNYRYVANAAFKESGKKYAVVNAYYGDLKYGSLGSGELASGGDAVITSFRHLSNMRLLRDYGQPVTYTIRRDLNWFTITSNGAGIETYSSDVCVFSESGGKIERFSPVPIPDPVTNAGKNYGDILNVVSFPSVPRININGKLVADENTLSTLPDTEDRTSVIRNVQMRMASFYDVNLDSYGLICNNQGTVVNLRANAMTISLDEVPDGSPDDREKIKDAIEKMRQGGTLSTSYPDWKTSSPLGGLVGANNGIIGSSTETDLKKNTMKVSNCIIMAGQWSGGTWQIHSVSATGGIVGDNNGKNANPSIFGRLEATGDFASAGWIDVSSLVGYSKCSIAAEMIVDNTRDTDLSIIKFNNNVSSFIYGTTDSVGGAIGGMDNTSNLSQSVTAAPLTSSVDSGGKVTIYEVSGATYQVNVKLDENSYILVEPDGSHKKGTDPKDLQREAGIGGAIGRIKSYRSGFLSVRVENSGIITSFGTNNTNIASRNIGGAIGVITGSAPITNAYIYVENNGKIGTNLAGTAVSGRANTTGGAIGRINTAGSASGTFTIKAINNGPIYGDYCISTDYIGVGGGIGAVTGNSVPAYRMCILNNTGSSIYGKNLSMTTGTDNTNQFGTGGAIGYMQYTPADGSIYSYVGKNVSISSTGSNTGGCIGTLRERIYTATGGKYTNITADLITGSSVSCTGFNAGGCIGNAPAVHHYTNLRSRINGSVYITAAQDAGGVLGRISTSATNEYSSVTLKSLSDTSVINVKASSGKDADPAAGNDNAGGLIGLASGGSSEYKLTLQMPSQTAGDTLIVNVDGYDNAGGIIGHYTNYAHSISTPIGVYLHPDSHVRAFNDNAGGAIGKFDSSYQLSSSVTVCDAVAITSTSIPYIQSVTGCAGGAIGYATTGTKSVSGNIAVNVTKLNIYGLSNTGGCIGHLYNSSVAGSITASGTNIGISGTSNTGGIIGYHDLNTINGTGLIQFLASSCIISGTDNTGGCIGHVSGSKDNYGAISFDGSESSVTGSGTCIGGCVGKYENSTMKSTSSIKFGGSKMTITGTNNTGGVIGSFTSASISGGAIVQFEGSENGVNGRNNTGGIFGYLNGSSSDTNSKYTFKGTKTTITGNDNVGGILGFSDNSANPAQITMAPSTTCMVKGNNEVGGIAGLASANNNNLTKHPVISLDECTFEIIGEGYTGGIIGKAQSKCYYSGGVLDITDKSVLRITSNNKAAAGDIAYMSDVNLGPGSSELRINCTGGSKIEVIGKEAAGGLVGTMADEGKQNQPKIYVSVKDSSFIIKATGNGGGAGGIVGVNKSDFGRKENTTFNIPANNGSLTVTADKGYAGALVGINNGSFLGNGASTKYAIRASVSGTNATEKDFLFGLSSTNREMNFTYSINGGPYHLIADAATYPL